MIAGPILLNISSFEHQMAEWSLERLGEALEAGNSLAVALLDIVFERHWCRSHIGALPHGVLGTPAAKIGEAELVAYFPDKVAAVHLYGLIVLEKAGAIRE